MDRQIRRLGFAFVALFALLFAQVAYIQVFAANRIADEPANAARQIRAEYSVERGQILAADERTVLAESVTNPDPNHDDYHYLRNPLGTEGNNELDPGEPYEDVGLDGVAGTCQQAAGVSGCYDVGEGNGKWDLSPNVERWYQADFLRNFAKLTPEQRRHMSLWFDAGGHAWLADRSSAGFFIAVPGAR